MDEAAASIRILPAHKQKKTVRSGDVEATIARIARIPPRRVSVSDKERLRSLDRDLKLTVFGQDAAIDTVATVLQTIGKAITTIGTSPIRAPIKFPFDTVAPSVETSFDTVAATIGTIGNSLTTVVETAIDSRAATFARALGKLTVAVVVPFEPVAFGV